MKRSKSKYKNIVIFFAFLVYPFFPLIKEWNSSYGLIFEALILLSVTVVALLHNEKGRRDFKFSSKMIIITIFLFFYFLMNIKDAYSSFSAFRAFFAYLLVFITIDNDLNNRQNGLVLSATKANNIASSIMSLGCIVQFIAPEIIKQAHNPSAWMMLRYKTDWTSFGIYNRALSFMTDPNVLGVYLSFSFILTTITFQKYRSKIYVMLSALEIVSIVLTQSRTAIFCMLIYILFVLVIRPFRKDRISKNNMLMVMIGMIIIGVFIILYLNNILSFLRVDTLYGGNGRIEKNGFQLSLYFNDLSSILIGHGLFDGRSIIFENSYILTFYMFGVCGTIILFYLCAQLIKPIICNDNIEIILTLLAALFVGDYILIPQVFLVVIICLLLNTSKKKLLGR